MRKGRFASTLISLIYPTVYSVAGRLFVLSSGRKGSVQFQPTISSFYETGIVTALYEHMLMSPQLAHLEIRHEMPYPSPGKGAPKRVDLWVRPPNGGYAHLIEAGDFSVQKVHSDLEKIRNINPKGSCWFIAFFRGSQSALDPWAEIEKSFNRKNGLDKSKVKTGSNFCGSFDVYRPDGNHDTFGYALFRAI